MTFCLPAESVIAANQLVLKPYEPHLVLDRGKLESALGRPMHTFDGQPMYPTVVQRAGVLLDGLAKAHAFQEGNKRTAWVSTTAYLAQNGFVLRQMDAEYAGSFVLSLVEHEIDVHQAMVWLTTHME